ncbi:MAG: hypothetical protein Q4E41_03430, partial [Bacteroidales bacterium]|nr:hypothetical protein [Bacteroidales bacterium]
ETAVTKSALQQKEPTATKNYGNVLIYEDVLLERSAQVFALHMVGCQFVRCRTLEPSVPTILCVKHFEAAF